MAVNQTTTLIGQLPSIPATKEIESKVDQIFGMEFPLGSLGNKGFFNKISGKRLILNNLKQLLNTERGERVMLPNFGISLRKYLFEPLDDITFNSLKDEIQTTITAYEPRVKIRRLRVNVLDEFNNSGFPALHVVLTVQIKESVLPSFDVQVKIK